MKDQLTAVIRQVLHKHDLMELIVHGAPRDEYEPEARTIADRILDEKVLQSDMPRVVREEFQRWFGIDGTGLPFDIPQDKYDKASKDIWAAYLNLQWLALRAAAFGIPGDTK